MENSKPEIAIWEDEYRGHNLAFVEILIRYISEKTKKPVLFFSSKAAFQSEAYQVYLKPLERWFIPGTVSEKHNVGKAWEIWGRFGEIEKELKNKGIHCLIVSTADSLARTLGLAHLIGWKPKDLEIRCLLMYLGIAYAGRNGLSRLRDRVSFWLKRQAPIRASYLDQWAVEKVLEKTGISLTTCPEPPYCLAEYLRDRPIRKKLGNGENICFGFPGGARFGDRKGPDLLIDAFLKADLPSNTQLVFAGPFSDPPLLEKFKQAQAKLGGRFQVFNGFLKTKELFSAVDQMDLVCLPYRSHIGTSAFFTQSATLGKVILASDYGWLGWAGRKYNKTIFFENDSELSLSKSLEKAALEFSRMDSIASNYSPAAEEDFARVVAGF